ncbi:hypothetical protein ACQHMI_26030, partial [Escherichia coli]|uniref:hypothetical protein n=1 Tax=Escherichia coli TaxID=562 RepID=UPI003CF2ACD9
RHSLHWKTPQGYGRNMRPCEGTDQEENTRQYLSLVSRHHEKAMRIYSRRMIARGQNMKNDKSR